MTQSWEDNAKSFAASVFPSSSHLVCPQSSQCANLRCSGDRNVVRLLALREISPRAKRYSKRWWGETSDGGADSTRLKFGVIDTKRALYSWVESESLRHLTAKYCPLLPPPRSTIAAAFSSDGKTLASTHGDHTVKIIDCQTGNCLKVLSGHRRTPWVADTSLAIEVRYMKKWEFCSPDQASTCISLWILGRLSETQTLKSYLKKMADIDLHLLDAQSFSKEISNRKSSPLDYNGYLRGCGTSDQLQNPI